MIPPINNPKLNTEIDLGVESSCNCFCCPVIRKSSTPPRPELVGKDSASRKFTLWGSSKKTSPSTEASSPAPVIQSKKDKSTSVFLDLIKEEKKDSLE